MTERAAQPGDTRAGLAAVAAIAATYFYFLIFAEFALLELARAVAPEQLRLLMAGLGAGGVAGAVAAAWRFRADAWARQLAWLLRASAAAALLTLMPTTVGGFFAATLAVGVALGALTVTLAAGLRGALGAGRLGLGIGAGTGLAYALCNLPWLFRAPATTQTLLAAAAVAAASFAMRSGRRPATPLHEMTHDHSPAGAARWVVMLLALVWMDSAAFYIVQHTADLRAGTWGGDAALTVNAAVHFCAALAAGAWLDRGGRAAVTALAGAALAVACLMLNGTLPAVVPPAWFYTAGVSLYSTVLVEYPARSASARRAALVFGVAGWVGSALGIGMAQDLARVPTAFVAAAGAAIAVALVWRARAGRRAVLAGVLAAAATTAKADDLAAQIAAGREVYIAEGCMHCHSQFVRPRMPTDVLRWGPAEANLPPHGAAMPLYGNRRQGPDLAAVGNRRSPEWNRLHLIAPRAVSPGSRMPAYAHLFGAGETRGEALVAYLASLGADTHTARQAQIAAWQPDTSVVTPPAAAARLFRQLCAPCHGDDGRGDGPLAARLSYRPPDWSTMPFRHAPAGPGQEAALSRIVKFGLPGLPMAGHEYLPDRDAVGLARYVRTLHNARCDGPAVASEP